MRKAVLVVIFTSVLMAGSALAHHPSGGAGLGTAGPVKTISASTLQAGKLSFALQFELIELDEFSDSQLHSYADHGKDVHSADSIFHSVLGMGYGITDDLTVSLRLPYEQVNNVREVHSAEPDEIHVHGDAKGFGDLTVMGQYRFLKTADDLESAVFFGLRIPTGKTNDRDIEGETFETEFLPGTGSWGPIVGIAATRRTGRVSVDANLQYTFGMTGTQRTNLGDIFDYNASVSYRAVSGKISWDLILEANGQWKEKQKAGSMKDENSGGNVIFLSPGMRLIFDKKASAFLSIGIPVVQNMNGIQDDTRYKALFGVSFSL